MGKNNLPEAIRLLQVELGGTARDAGLARAYLARVLPDVGWSHKVDYAGLLVTELIANVAMHAGTPCTLTVRADDQTLEVDVADLDPALPTCRSGPLDATSGRGLPLLDALADKWGVRSLPAGKSVWFRFGR